MSAKLALLVGVILLGALLNTATVDAMLEATAVFKPGGRIRASARSVADPVDSDGESAKLLYKMSELVRSQRKESLP